MKLVLGIAAALLAQNSMIMPEMFDGTDLQFGLRLESFALCADSVSATHIVRSEENGATLTIKISRPYQLALARYTKPRVGQEVTLYSGRVAVRTSTLLEPLHSGILIEQIPLGDAARVSALANMPCPNAATGDDVP